MFPAQTKQIEKGTISVARDIGSILSNSGVESQSTSLLIIHNRVNVGTFHSLLVRGGADAARERALMHTVEGVSVNPVTEPEAEQAIAELRAQHTALDRVRDTVAALAHNRIPLAMPATWSGASARAYELRLHDIDAQLTISESSLDGALDAVLHDIASVQADTAAHMESGRVKEGR